MSLYSTPEPDWDAPAEPVPRRERIAIVGSRDYPRLHLVRRYIRTLAPSATVISGARAPDTEVDEAITDVDSCAIREAERCGLTVQVFPPDSHGGGRAAAVHCNALIAEAADKVLAFWDGKSRGPLDSVRTARAAGKPVAVIGPDGKKVVGPAKAP
jgi:hypothetical protein